MTGYHKTRGGQFGLERAGESRFAIEGSAVSKRGYSSRTTRHSNTIATGSPKFNHFIVQCGIIRASSPVRALSEVCASRLL